VSNLPALAHTPSLLVQQRKEMLEVFTDFESANRYTIADPNGQTLMHAAEMGTGGMAWLTRSFLTTKRPFEMQLVDPAGGLVLKLQRPWNWFFSELHVHDAAGNKLGWIDQRWAFLARKFTIHGPANEELAELHGPFFRPWTFRIIVGGNEVGVIKKQWSGFLKEAFTDADTFGLELGPSMNLQLRTLALAATFLIDFLYFEGR
jgi:uncharacterized protein YxjI